MQILFWNSCATEQCVVTSRPGLIRNVMIQKYRINKSATMCSVVSLYLVTIYHIPTVKWRTSTKSKRSQKTENGQLRRFALAFIHSHSGASGGFRNAFMVKVAVATSCLQKTLQTT